MQLISVSKVNDNKLINFMYKDLLKNLDNKINFNYFLILESDIK